MDPKNDQRMIIEMGMGNDLHGMDYQKAARRAIEDAGNDFDGAVHLRSK